jgi:hypothetical protein
MNTMFTADTAVAIARARQHSARPAAPHRAA